MKTRWILLVSVFLSVMIVNSVYAEYVYRWGKKPYDNFNNSAVIDTTKWVIDDTAASITIENGRAKFVHDGPANDSAWLIVKRSPLNVWGIRATVTFQSCQFSDPTKRDVRARVAGTIGFEAPTLTDEIWSHLIVEPYYKNGNIPYIYGNASILDLTLPETDPNYWVEDLFWGRFPYENGMVPEDIMGVPLIVTMTWRTGNTGYVSYTVAYAGNMTYKWGATVPVRKITDPTKVLVGIGTRSPSGAGTCTVYFDDVYILRRYSY
jgi:hypothetical protein